MVLGTRGPLLWRCGVLVVVAGWVWCFLRWRELGDLVLGGGDAEWQSHTILTRSLLRGGLGVYRGSA